jgi:hypothetical protein
VCSPRELRRWFEKTFAITGSGNAPATAMGRTDFGLHSQRLYFRKVIAYF